MFPVEVKSEIPMKPKLTPEEIDSRVSQFICGRIFTSETEAIAIRDALAVGQPAFRSSGDVLEDLDRLVPIYRTSQLSPAGSKTSAAAPVPAASSSAPVAPVPVPHGNAPAPAAGAAMPSGLVAQYEAVRHDPAALADFLAENGKAVLREIQRMDREQQASEPRTTVPTLVPCPASGSPPALLAEYEAAKGDPKKLAALLNPTTEKGKAIRRLLIPAA